MHTGRPPKDLPPPRHGYGKALQTGFRHTSQQVQDMHHAIANTTFDTLQRVPLLAAPTKLIQRLHDAIVDGSYAAVRHGGKAVLTAVSAVEHRVGPKQRLGALESALNGVFGDFLERSQNPLATAMGFYVDDHCIDLATETLTAALSTTSSKVCVFIHGLCLDEHCWQGGEPERQQRDFGVSLQAEYGYTPLYVRYNTGLGLANNGEQFAKQLQALVDAYPPPISELVLIGHSMGGLVARSACDIAAAKQLGWLAKTRMLICLGSPNTGSNLEKLGQITTNGLHRFAITQPLGKLAEGRSTGIKQLRHGLETSGGSVAAAPHLAYRFIGAGLAKRLDHPVSRLVGDGLVTFDSATAPDLRGDIKAVRLGGISHIGLLKSPAVYDQICQWLNEASVAPLAS